MRLIFSIFILRCSVDLFRFSVREGGRCLAIREGDLF